MNPKIKISWRTEPRESDKKDTLEIVSSLDFFSDEEKEIAVELVSERLERGLARSGYLFIFADVNENTIGYSCFGPIPGTNGSYDLYWIALKNEFRGRGIGTEILKRSEQQIREMGGRRIYIETSSRELYRPTQLFYGGQGYIKEAVLRDFYSPGDDKLIYVREIK